jgi:hypothetical protein
VPGGREAGVGFGLGGSDICVEGGKVEANIGLDCSCWTDVNEIGGDLSAVFHRDAPGVDRPGDAGFEACC